MDLVWVYRVAIQVSDNFYWVHLALNFNFIRLHHLLNSGSYIPESDIDSCLFQACISGVLNSFQQLVICRVKCYSKGTVDDPPMDMSPEVYFAYVIRSNDSVIAVVRSIVGSNMVE